MKIKECTSKVGDFIIFSIVFLFFLPFFLLLLLFKLITFPIDYVKYKRSRYQQDFPHKYKWLDMPHIDNIPYTAIKENNLPIEYIKWHEDYEFAGYFIYKNILLDFSLPFFFAKDKGLWLSWFGNEEDETLENNDDEEENIDFENTDNCLTVEETKSLILEAFHRNIQGRECNNVVFFYSRKGVEKNYDEGGLEKMRELDDFIIYEKNELPKVLKQFVDTH